MGFVALLFVVLFKFFFWIGFSIGKMIGWIFAIILNLLMMLVKESFWPFLKWVFNKGRHFMLNQWKEKENLIFCLNVLFPFVYLLNIVLVSYLF